jgi:hypothetical protein
MKSDSINKNNDQIQNVKSASPIPLSWDDNNKINTLSMTDRLQIEHPDVCKYSGFPLFANETFANRTFANGESPAVYSRKNSGLSPIGQCPQGELAKVH